MEALEKNLSRVLTVIIVLLTIVCLVLAAKIIQGKDASLFGFRIYHILTGSMEPTIATGSDVLVREVDPYTLQPGDIITFTSRDAAIYGSANTHRIISVEHGTQGETFFVTQGDANSIADQLYVYPQDVKGKVVFYMKSAGFAMFLSFLHTPMGLISVIVIPMMFILFLFMRNFREQVNQMIEENAKLEADEEKNE